MNPGGEDDDHPVLLIDRDGTLWMAWIGYRDGDDGDDIFIQSKVDGKWNPKEKLNAEIGDFHRLTMAQDEKGGIWLIWAGFENNNWDLYGKYYFGLTPPTLGSP